MFALVFAGFGGCLYYVRRVWAGWAPGGRWGMTRPPLVIGHARGHRWAGWAHGEPCAGRDRWRFAWCVVWFLCVFVRLRPPFGDCARECVRGSVTLVCARCRYFRHGKETEAERQVITQHSRSGCGARRVRHSNRASHHGEQHHSGTGEHQPVATDQGGPGTAQREQRTRSEPSPRTPAHLTAGRERDQQPSP